MQYRALADQKEIETYQEMVRLAFVETPEDIRTWLAIHPFTPQNSRGLFDDEGTLLCGMEIIDGGALYFRTEKPIPTALITAVASPPEQRRRGYIRKLFEGMYDEQRQQGVALTALYPFYFPFYRAFGYELAHDAAEYTVKIRQFKPWREAARRGRFVPLSSAAIRAEGVEAVEQAKNHPGLRAELDTLNDLYTRWASRNLGTIARNSAWWTGKLIHKNSFVPAYLYYNPEGQPAGYIIYHFEDKGNWVREMIVREMLAVDSASWEAIYGFIYNHDSQAEKVKFWMPVDAAFATRLPDPRGAEVKVHPGYMLRLLDVVGAFQQRDFAPEAQGEFTFALTDEMIPANNATFRVQVSDGRARVEKLPVGAGEHAGLELNQRILAQLYGGYISPLHAATTGQIRVVREADLQGMQAVLHPCGQPAPFMADDF
jgi:predicted acetyltransferase